MNIASQQDGPISHSSEGATGPPAATPEPKAKPPSISQRAAQAVKGLGSGFLGDDEDDEN